ncbi:MAG: lipid-A-disaccharide synthase [Gammaproteobacteria bacterium]
MTTLMEKPKTIFLVSGEASGDLHGSNLIRDLKAHDPNLLFLAMGGDRMQDAGAELVINSQDLAFVGLGDVLKNIVKLRRIFHKVLHSIRESKPDLVILIDYPGFNLRLAKKIKQLGIRVLYYISPQIWAWHQSRIRLIRNYIDHMAVILPFEAAFYQQYGVPVTFVGHPLLKTVKPSMTKTAARTYFAIDDDDLVIGLMPGSRKSEIRYLLPVMIEAAEIIHEHYINSTFILPLAANLHESEIRPYLDNAKVPIKIIKENHYDAMQVCSAMIVASGTATLEVAILGIPEVLIYKTSRFNYTLGKRLIKVPFLGLCNLIMGKEVIPELWQYDVTPAAIANKIQTIFSNTSYREQMLADFRKVREMLDVHVDADISKVVLKLLG